MIMQQKVYNIMYHIKDKCDAKSFVNGSGTNSYIFTVLQPLYWHSLSNK